MRALDVEGYIKAVCSPDLAKREGSQQGRPDRAPLYSMNSYSEVVVLCKGTAELQLDDRAML